MAIKLNTINTTVPLVWTGDPSISEAAKPEEYSADPARVASLMPHDGNATIFHCRPLTHKQEMALADKVDVSGLESFLARYQYQCVEALKDSLDRVENLHPDLDGKGGAAVVAALPLNVAFAIGMLVMRLSSARGAEGPASAMGQLDALRADVRALTSALSVSDLPEGDARDALARLAERVELPPHATLDPDEDAGEDLPK